MITTNNNSRLQFGQPEKNSLIERNLHRDALYEVFSHLDDRSLQNASLASRYFREIAVETSKRKNLPHIKPYFTKFVENLKISSEEKIELHLKLEAALDESSPEKALSLKEVKSSFHLLNLKLEEIFKDIILYREDLLIEELESPPEALFEFIFNLFAESEYNELLKGRFSDSYRYTQLFIFLASHGYLDKALEISNRISQCHDIKLSTQIEIFHELISNNYFAKGKKLLRQKDLGCSHDHIPILVREYFKNRFVHLINEEHDLSKFWELAPLLNSGRRTPLHEVLFKRSLKIALEFLEMNKFDAALKVIKTIPSTDWIKNSESQEMGALLGKIALELGQNGLVEKGLYIAKTIDFPQESMRAQASIAKLLANKGDFDKSLNIALSLSEDFDDFKDLITHIIDKLIERNNPQKAMELFEKYRIRLDFFSLIKIKNSLLSYNYFEEAIALLNNMKDEDPLKRSFKNEILENKAAHLPIDKILSLIEESDWTLNKHSPSLLKMSKKIVLTLIAKGESPLPFISKNLLDDEEVIFQALLKDPYSYYYASDRLKGKKELALKVIPLNPRIAEYIPDHLLDDKDIISTLFQCYNLPYSTPSCLILSNKAQLLSLVKDNWIFLRYATKTLQNDKDVVRIALNNSYKAFRYASKELQDSREFANFKSSLLKDS